METRRPNILVIATGLIPSVIIGVVKPLLELQRRNVLKFKVTLSRFYRSQQLGNIDLVIFCRNCAVSELTVLHHLAERKIPYIYEIDDNFFAIDPATELGQYYRHPATLYTLRKFIHNAQLVRVYNQLLADRCLAINKNLVVTKCYFDFDLIDRIKVKHSEKIRIVYATSRFTEDTSQDIFLMALLKIAEKYQDKIEIYFWGASIHSHLLGSLKNIICLAPIMNYRKFIKNFYAMGFDIGLAPLMDDEFHNSKTNNKYREYGACGVAGVYSNTTLYQQCIQHKENGMLVNNTETAWFDALEELINNSDLRQKIKKLACEDVRENYTFSNQVETWEKNIKQVLQSGQKMNDLVKYDVVCISEFSTAPAKNNIIEIIYFNICMLLILTHESGHKKGYRNFVIHLQNSIHFEQLKKFKFYEDSKYIIFDPSHHVLINRFQLPVNAYVVGVQRWTKEIDDSVYFFSESYKFNESEVNNFVEECEFIFDKFLVKNNVINTRQGRLLRIKSQCMRYSNKIYGIICRRLDIYAKLLKKIWWYRSHIFGLIKINYFKRY